MYKFSPFYVWLTKHRNKIEGREMNIFTRQVHYLGPGKRRHFNFFFATTDIDSMKYMYNFSSFCVFIQNQNKTTTNSKASGKRQNREYDSVWVLKNKTRCWYLHGNSEFFFFVFRSFISPFQFLNIFYMFVCFMD